MSSPTTAVDFDDVIDRAWSGFATVLVERLTTAGDDLAVDLSREHLRTDGESDLRFRRLPTGMVCAVVAMPAGATPSDGSHPGWSSPDGGHLVRIAERDDVSSLVHEAVELARTLLALPHPSFLRDDNATRARARSMAAHPAGGLSRVVGTVVRDRLAGIVGIDVHDAVELTYPDATAHLQVWGPQRSALLWTTIRGAVDPDGIEDARRMMAQWPGFELIADGSVVDIELAVDLGSDPRAAIAVAIDQWHEFMIDGLPALTDHLATPATTDDIEMPSALRVALSRERVGRTPDAAGVAALCGSDRMVVVDSLEVCRNQSILWLHHADERTAHSDLAGAQDALDAATRWDDMFAVFSEALRILVGRAV